MVTADVSRPRRAGRPPAGADEVPRLARVRRAARAHFAERGYEAASMREIAADAGIRISTLYFYCTTKEQLLFDLLREEMEEITGQLAERIEAAGPSWSDRLAAAIAFHVRICAERTFGATFNNTDMRFLTPEHAHEFIRMRDAYERLFRDVVRGGVEAGEFRAVDPKLTTFSIVGTGLTVGRWYRPQGTLGPEEIGRQYVELFFHALRPGGTAARSTRWASEGEKG